MKAILISVMGILLSFTLIFILITYTNNKSKLSTYINIPSLLNEKEFLNTKQLLGKTYIINVFSSWCPTCEQEHTVWMKIANENIIELYGIDYLDIPNKAQEWLKKHGNPYKLVGTDYNGSTSKILGITGIPETFVFDKKGKIIFHLSGNMTMEIWLHKVLPLLKKFQ